MAADPARDQSYFLFSTTPEQLDYLRFPLGHLASKAETRALAAKLWPARGRQARQPGHLLRAERQLRRRHREAAPRRRRPGRDRRSWTATSSGRHAGVLHYTVGQRKRPRHRRAGGAALRRAPRPRRPPRDRRARRRCSRPASSRCARSTGWATPVRRARRGHFRSRSAPPAPRARRSCARLAHGGRGRTPDARGRRLSGSGLRVLRDGRHPRPRRRLDLARPIEGGVTAPGSIEPQVSRG
jgi:hypothetical protein